MTSIAATKLRRCHRSVTSVTYARKHEKTDEGDPRSHGVDRNPCTARPTNWKEVGGKDAKIVLYSRENSSGTYVFFKEHVLKQADYTPRTQSVPGTAAVVNAVAKDKNAIGYGGAAYAKGIFVIPIKKDDGSPAVTDLAHVQDGSYPLSRPLFFYLRDKPAGEIKAFIDWVLSKEGQDVITKVGYFPVK